MTTKHTPELVACQHSADCSIDCQASQRGLWIAPDKGTWFVYYAHDLSPVEDDNGNEFYGAWDQVIAEFGNRKEAEDFVAKAEARS